MWKLLRSKKLALTLILLLALETAVAMFIPQKALTDPVFRRWAWEHPGLAPLIAALQLNNFFAAPLFLVTGACFWLNTFACTLDQGKLAWRSFSRPFPKAKGRLLFTGHVDLEKRAGIMEQIAGVLSFRKCQNNLFYGADKTSLVAYRSRWGLWGMTLFHLSLLWIVSAAALGEALSIEGNAIVAEDLNFFESHRDYAYVQEGLLFRERHAGFEVLVNQVMFNFRDNKAPELDRAVVTIREGGREVTKATLFFRKQLVYKGYKLQLGRRGYTPVLLVDDGGGAPGLNYLSLNVAPVPGGGETYRQKVFIRDLGREVGLWFFPSPPDAVKRNLNYHINRPQLEISYTDSNGREQTRTIGLNQPIQIGDKQVTLVDVKLWIELFVTKTPGVNQIFWAFALALAGLGLHYGLPYQQVSFVLSADGKLAVYGYARLYPVSFNNRVARLVEEVAAHTALEFVRFNREEDDKW